MASLLNMSGGSLLKKGLPYDAEIEYLESSGTQGIDTLLSYFADFEIGIKLRENKKNYALGVDTNKSLSRISEELPCWQFSSINSYMTNIPIAEYHVLKWADDKIFCDGVYLSDFTKERESTVQHMILFGIPGAYRANIIYYCKLYSPTTHSIVRDFIPVRVGTTGYMYDKVSGQLFGNAGTGSFILGADV